MKLFRRTSETSGGPSEEQVDGLATLAGHLAESEPDSERTADALRRWVDAAEALAQAAETVENRRRLGRALFRQGSAIAQGDRPAADFVAGARRCWLVSRQTVELTDPRDPRYDLLVGELMQRAAAFVVPVLSAAGYQDDVTEVMQVCGLLGEGRSAGPHTQHGIARMNLILLVTISDQYVKDRLNGSLEATQAREVPGLTATAEHTADTLRRYRDDGPLEVTELATALRALSRLQFAGNAIEAANHNLSEAISLYASVAGLGPNYRKFLRDIEAERDSLDEYVRITSSSSESVPAGDRTPPELLADQVARIDRGIALGGEGDLPPAQEVLTMAASALDLLRLQKSAEGISADVLRHLARARWRLAMVQNLNGDPVRALHTGLLAVQSGRGWLRTLPPGTDQHAPATAEVAVMATDAAEIAFGAGRDEAGTELIQEAVSLCRGVSHPAARRALATALHNHANAVVSAVLSKAQSGGFTGPEAARVPAQLRAAHADASEAVALRRESRSHEDAVTWYELANSLLLLSITSALQNRREAAVALLAEALDEARPLAPSPAVNAFRSRAAAHAGRLNVTGP